MPAARGVIQSAHGALAPGRALDPAQGRERLVQPLAFGLARPPHRRGGGVTRGLGAVGAGASTALAARVPSAAPDELAEQRRRTLGTRLELRVVLRGDEERMHVARQLDHLDQPLVRATCPSRSARPPPGAGAGGC